MMTGVVNAKLEATLTVRVIGPGGQFQEVPTVIDTGYNGFITLPISITTALSLVKSAAREVTLGDASRKVFEYYTAQVIWEGQPHKVRVLNIEGDPLIGTALLAGYKLEADFVVGGTVVLQPVP
ncbi:MAG TPA: clan AA aspartic protease [Chthonomonadaceae bacterium]|nr:clan AA aspartic protease [Chthonomonadaceae bacterium]